MISREEVKYMIDTAIRQKCCCGDPNEDCCYQELTYIEAQTLVANNTVIPNKLYKITDRGDRGIFLVGISSNKFEEEGVRLMLIPNYTLVESILVGDWGIRGVYSIGDKAFYMGLVYTNLTGDNLGAPDGNPTDWEVVPKESFFNNEYKEKQFGIIYDFDNDWIEKQWDEHDNVFGIPYNRNQVYGGINPVDVSDWIYADYLIEFSTILNNWDNYQFHSNHCIGIWGNGYSGSASDFYKIYNNHLKEGAIHDNNLEEIEIYDNYIDGNINYNGNYDIEGHIHISSNSNRGSISGNTAQKVIEYNTNIGDISDNSNVGNISYNNNIGGISGNNNNGAIIGNRNTGDILNNGNNGSILANSNNGSIIANVNVGQISYNINNGDISGNATTDPGEGDPITTDITSNSNNGGIVDNIVSIWIDRNANNGHITNVVISGLNGVYYNFNNGDIGPVTESAPISITNNDNNGTIGSLSPYGVDIIGTIVNI